MTLQFDNFSPSGTTYAGYGGGKTGVLVAGRGAGAFAAGSGKIAVGVQGRGSVTSGVPVPITPSTGGGQLNTRLAGTGFERLFGAGGAGKVGVRAPVGAAPALAYGAGRIGIYGEGQEVPPIQNYAFYLKAPPIMQAFANYAYTATIEGVAMSDMRERFYTALVRAVVRIDQRELPTWAGTKRVRDVLATDDGLNWVRQLLIAEGLVLDDTIVPDWRALGRVVSGLILSGHASGVAEALAIIAEAVTLTSFEKALLLALVADDVELTSQLTHRYLQIVAVIERMLLEASQSSVYQLVVLVSEDFVLDTGENGQVDMVALLREAIGLTIGLEFDDGRYIAWTLNTESGGLSSYSNYPFNSYFKLGQRYYGVHAGGIVELVGDTDAGTAIAARLRFGMFDFNDRHEKTYEDAFLGVAANGDLLLKVIFVTNKGQHAGKKVMAVYKVNYRPSGSQRDTRAKIGRGVQAVDFDFVLENVDGADFDLSNIQFNPVVGARRTRG